MDVWVTGPELLGYGAESSCEELKLLGYGAESSYTGQVFELMVPRRATRG